MAENPRDLPRDKNVLPVSYYHAKKAWMTRILFRKWFFEEFILAVRKFCEKNGLEPKALLLDNCSAHHDGCELKSDDGLIQVIYLPPNVTSECQPMDQAVINAIKIRYKRKLMLKLVLENEHLPFNQRLKNISLSTCIEWLATSWDEISSSTIRNSWNKLVDEFPGYENREILPAEENSQSQDIDIRLLITAADEAAGTKTNDSDIDCWLNDKVVDSEGNTLSKTCYEYTDEEIVKSVLSRQDDSTCTEEEWLDTSCEQSEIDESIDQQTCYDEASNYKPDFSSVLKSLDNVIEYVRNDTEEVKKLFSLRNKLIDTEWNKRNT
ncbi:jerky protein homolog-like [Sabethes cyaneus]|uniref:jerky protein homolog-like n=1 Tax=Sabethes cyaneus TaxID=53552 RepID=UPI00237D32F5|nr:jerky protein homolog-like [Sabethes cyaneus]